MRVHRGLVPGALLAVLVGSAALAAGHGDDDATLTAWGSTSSARAGAHGFEVLVDPVEDMFPGRTRRLRVHLLNHRGRTISVTGYRVRVSVPDGPRACHRSDLEPPAGTVHPDGGLTIRPDDSRTLRLPISMDADVSNRCQDLVYEVTVTADAVEVRR